MAEPVTILNKGESMSKSWIAMGSLGFMLAACGDNSESQNPPPTQQAVEQKLITVPVSAVGHDRFYSVAVGTDQSIYAVGNVAESTAAATADFETVVMKFDEHGVADTGFGSGGAARVNLVVGLNGELTRGIVLQSDGKIVVSATVDHVGATDTRDRDVAVARFNSNGSLDKGFGNQGIAIFDLSTGIVDGESFRADSNWNIIADVNDRLVLSGSRVRKNAKDTDFVVMRLTKDGEFDKSFSDGGVFGLDIGNNNASPKQVLFGSDGSIYATGYMNGGASTPVRPVIYKLLPTGKLDVDFGHEGYVSEVIVSAATEAFATAEAYGAVFQADKLVTAGYGRKAATDSLDWVSFRFDKNGQRDTSFGQGGVVQIDVNNFNDNARGLIALPDGRLLLVGGGRTAETNADGMVALLTRDGGLDTSFAETGKKLFDFGGANDVLWSAALSPDQRFIAAVGIKGVATGSSDANANDDGVLLIMPMP
jgi:uncharacterized delta-60 repeat protein